jgi:hypothetical protein
MPLRSPGLGSAAANSGGGELARHQERTGSASMPVRLSASSALNSWRDANSEGVAIHPRLLRGPIGRGPRSTGDVGTLPLGPLERLQPGPAASGVASVDRGSDESFLLVIRSHSTHVLQGMRASQRKRLPQQPLVAPSAPESCTARTLLSPGAASILQRDPRVASNRRFRRFRRLRQGR